MVGGRGLVGWSAGNCGFGDRRHIHGWSSDPIRSLAFAGREPSGSPMFNEVSGRPVGKADLDRIRSLAVPPAWTNVWIAADRAQPPPGNGSRCPRPQAVPLPPGVHRQPRPTTSSPTSCRSATPSVLSRRRVVATSVATTLDHDSVVAAVVRLLDITSLRVGNAEYARDEPLVRAHHAAQRPRRGRAARRSGSAFRGKSAHRLRCARRQPAPGARSFGGVSTCRANSCSNTGRTRVRCARVGSTDVNAYLVEHAGPGVTAKTFRTWNATVRAAELAGRGQRTRWCPRPNAC